MSAIARRSSSSVAASWQSNATPFPSATSGWRTRPWKSGLPPRSARSETTGHAAPRPPAPPYRDRGHRDRGRRRAGAQLLPLVTALEDEGMTKPETPFPRHWLYYIVLKYAVIAAAVLIALYVAAQLLWGHHCPRTPLSLFHHPPRPGASPQAPFSAPRQPL